MDKILDFLKKGMILICIIGISSAMYNYYFGDLTEIQKISNDVHFFGYIITSFVLTR